MEQSATKSPQQRMAELIRDLSIYKIPSLSPPVGKHLLSIHKALSRTENPSAEVLAYKAALQIVTKIAVLHQAAVIQTLEDLIAGKEDEDKTNPS